MQNERVNVGAKLRNEERDAVNHESADEVNVSRKSVEFGHGDGAMALAGVRERRCKLRPAIEGISSLPGFHFHVFPDDFETISFRELGQSLTLGLDPEARAALLR